MQHAKLSPSGSSRWLNCTASVKASEPYANTTNSAASWGTTTHALGEMLLKDEEPKVGDVVEGEVVDQEMLTCAEDYASYCINLMTRDSVVMIEEQFDLSFIAPNTFGTGDFSVLNGTHLDIVDLKTGQNLVDADGNSQLMLYALGAIHELEDLYDIETVTLHIMQSRVGHISTWDTTVDALYLFEDFAKGKADDIIADNVSFSPEKKACQYCPHQANCEALAQHVNDVVTGSFDTIEDIDGKADTVNTAHMKSVLDNADLITGFVKAVQQVALEQMQNGVEIEGYKIVEGKSNRKWRDEDEVGKYLNRKIPSKDLWVKKMIPMTKILKMRPNDKGLQEMLIKPEGKPQLAPLSDKRPALSAVCNQFEDEDL